MTVADHEKLVQQIGQRVQEVREEIAQAAARSGRDATAVRLVAVTKTHPPELLAAAVEAGAREIGENYLQEAEDKFLALGWPSAGIDHPPVVRHAIGHIQTNKIRLALQWFEVIETIDSLRLAERLDTAAAALGRTVPVLLQVNISNEPTKYGFFSEEIEGVLHRVANLTHIRVDGLMTIGRFEPDPEAARGEFQALRTLRDRLRAVAPSGMCFDELSMGMSHDFPVAIEEGATIVRVGSRLFGSRPDK
ncbi:MAG TPA: YggS family pyridoxal phosphate-dependent enzyme [Armatimonadota bacterium]